MSRRRKIPTFESSGTCYAYLRVSTVVQERSGLGLMAQGDSCREKARELGLTFGSAHRDSAPAPRRGVFVDAGKSAFTTMFQKRPSAAAIAAAMRPGDTMIISRLDRAFRSVADFINVTTQMLEEGKMLVCCSPPINLTTATGRMFARHIANVAEWESDRKGERIREALAQKQERETPSAPRDQTSSADSDWRPVERDEPEKPHPYNEPGRVFLYIRCSHRDSAESGLGMLHQSDVVRAKADRLIAENPNLSLGGMYIDSVVSASDMNFRMRAHGSLLDAQLRPGDHVVFSTLDRGFRNVADMATTLPMWMDKGVHVHFASDGICMDTPDGRMLANVLVTFAQYESELISQRNKEARAQMAAKGRYCGGKCPSFWRIYKDGKVKKLLLDRRQLVSFKLCQWLRSKGMTCREAVDRCEVLWAKHWNNRTGRVPIPHFGTTRYTNIGKTVPKGYPANSEGVMHPWYPQQQYKTAVMFGGYDQAMEAWRKQAAERRRLRDEPSVEPPVVMPLDHRGWPKGQNAPNRGSSKGVAVRVENQRLARLAKEASLLTSDPEAPSEH